MRPAIVNGHYQITLPDEIAGWDAISHWERARFESYKKNLNWGDTFLDIGTEHGWMSAIIAREFVGAENMILVEPSVEMWRNIYLTWLHNGLPEPAASYAGFVADVPSRDTPKVEMTGVWPRWALGHEECPAMPYRSLLRHHDVPTSTVDQIVSDSGRRIAGVSIDVEGAEVLVLRGASEMLQMHRPLVWVSIHDGHEEHGDRALLDDFGHTAIDVHELMLDVGYIGHFLEWQHESHFLFYPEERAAEVKL